MMAPGISGQLSSKFIPSSVVMLVRKGSKQLLTRLIVAPINDKLGRLRGKIHRKQTQPE